MFPGCCVRIGIGMGREGGTGRCDWAGLGWAGLGGGGWKAGGLLEGSAGPLPSPPARSLASPDAGAGVSGLARASTVSPRLPSSAGLSLE